MTWLIVGKNTALKRMFRSIWSIRCTITTLWASMNSAFGLAPTLESTNLRFHVSLH